MTAEDQLIERIAKVMPTRGSSHIGRAATLRLGIGDDAAVVAPSGKTELVLSCDAFLEEVHFLADIHPADSVGYKSLVRATSDLAAMGATPRSFLLTLALPASRTGGWLDEFLRGMVRAARQLEMSLVGGDTAKSHTIFISITVVGEISPGRAVPRSGARPGDIIYVSGVLGRAQLGLLMVENEPDLALKKGLRGRSSPIQAHLYPQIRVDLGAWLARHRIASAMMDISDGLSTDLTRLCAASQVGARVWSDKIPTVEIPTRRSGKLIKSLNKLRIDPLQLALNGGEDYELLFTVPPKNEKRLRQAPEFADLTPIGKVERGRKIVLVGEDGKTKPLVSGGWDPFRGK